MLMLDPNSWHCLLPLHRPVPCWEWLMVPPAQEQLDHHPWSPHPCGTLCQGETCLSQTPQEPQCHSLRMPCLHPACSGTHPPFPDRGVGQLCNPSAFKALRTEQRTCSRFLGAAVQHPSGLPGPRGSCLARPYPQGRTVPAAPKLSSLHSPPKLLRASSHPLTKRERGLGEP